MPTHATDPTGRPTRLGPYVLTELLGQVGIANLYRAVHTGPNGFEKTVVVKAILPALLENRELVDRFSAEARTTAQVSHSGIVQVYDFGVDQGTPFVVTEHLDGINLAQLMGAVAAVCRRIPVGVALVIATEMCEALGFAHTWRDRHGVRRQIIHSDVSPENVMVCRDGAVKLLDLGAARIVDELDFDVSMRAKGRFAYMAPEQVNRLPFDRRVDVFAVGVVLHEMLTGRRLFAGHNDLDTVRRINAADVAPPSVHNSEVPPELDQVVLRALAREPDERFGDAEAMAAALQQIRYVGSGRRRVAEFIAGLFPECGQQSCELCHKPLVPVLMCVQCDTEVSSAKSAPPREDPAPPVVHVELAPEKPAPPVVHVVDLVAEKPAPPVVRVDLVPEKPAPPVVHVIDLVPEKAATPVLQVVELAPEKSAPTVLHVDLAREKAPQELPPPPPRPRTATGNIGQKAPAAPTSKGSYAALVSVAVVAILLAVGAVVHDQTRPAAEVAHSPAAPLALQPTAPSSPERSESRATPPASAPKADAAPQTKRKTEAARPPAERHKLASPVVQRTLPQLPTTAPPPVTAPPPAPPIAREEPPRVESAQKTTPAVAADPRLIDPFGAK
jgi:tRNA A-37 threonylcarbamoyl transferase component Bud32